VRTVARGGDLRDISWSSDGRWLSYVATALPNGRSELFRVSASGGRPTQLTRDLALVGRAAWRPAS
jgi:Tol biopolymer transport system component